MKTHHSFMAAGLLLAAGLCSANPGDLDPDFGLGGRVVIDVPDHYEAGTAIVQARDGKLLVGRQVINFPKADDFSILRLNSNGTLDTSFSGDGRAFVDLGTTSRGVTRALLEQADGMIVAAGHVTNENGLESQFGMARFAANGAADNAFGLAGVVRMNFGGMEGSLEAIVQQPDGRLVVAGYGRVGDQPYDMVIARFNSDGSLDTSFANGGFRSIDVFGANQDDSGWELVLQDDGKFVIGARGLNGAGERKLVLVRVMSDGSIDPTFGNMGFAMLDLPGLARANLSLRAQQDGGLVLGGQIIDEATNECSCVIARFTREGMADPTFNGNGVSQFPISSCQFPGGTSLVIEPDNAIVVANTVVPLPIPPSDVKVRRITSSGQIDDSFGINGLAIVDIGLPWSSRVDASTGARMVRQSDGRIALVASDQFDWDLGGSYFVVARLLASGGSAGVIGFAHDYVSVSEDAGTATFVVRRTGGTAGAISVEFESVDDPATADDITPARGTLTWLDGDASDRTISVTITDDSIGESSDWIRLELSAPTGGAQLAASRAFLIIDESDGGVPPPPPPTNSAPPPNPPAHASGGGGSFSLAWVLALFLLMGALEGLRFRPVRHSPQHPL